LTCGSATATCAKTIKRWVEKGVLPMPIKFTGSQFAPDMFLVSELDEYDQRRLAQRGKPGRKPKSAGTRTGSAPSITSDDAAA
jgi:hypothetical protein